MERGYGIGFFKELGCFGRSKEIGENEVSLVKREIGLSRDR